MFTFIKNLFKPRKEFLTEKRFWNRVDAIMREYLDDAPTLWGIDVLMRTTQEAEAWMVLNEKAITEEQYIAMLMRNIELYMDKPLPPIFLDRTLRDRRNSRSGKKP